MANLYPEDLAFIQEAKAEFEAHFELETHIDTERKLIALRFGPDRDCLKIFRLDGEVCFVHNIMQPAPAKLRKKSERGIHL